MQAQLFFSIPAGIADLGQPAGGHETGWPAAQPAGAVRIVIGGMDGAGGGQEGQRRAAELQVIQAHAAFQQDTEGQSGSVAEGYAACAALTPIRKLERADIRQLAQVADGLHQLGAGIFSSPDLRHASSFQGMAGRCAAGRQGDDHLPGFYFG
jgi:hypothetical protein